jgi:hypothetical protein
MRARGVSEADVEDALGSPVAKPGPGNRPGNLVVTGFNAVGMPLRVVVSAADMNHVVSVLT